MKEQKEVMLKGELFKLFTLNLPQRLNENTKEHTGRLLDLIEDVFNIFQKYNDRK